LSGQVPASSRQTPAGLPANGRPVNASMIWIRMRELQDGAFEPSKGSLLAGRDGLVRTGVSEAENGGGPGSPARRGGLITSWMW
jgi:hypothetical protein